MIYRYYRVPEVIQIVNECMVSAEQSAEVTTIQKRHRFFLKGSGVHGPADIFLYTHCHSIENK